MGHTLPYSIMVILSYSCCIHICSTAVQGIQVQYLAVCRCSLQLTAVPPYSTAIPPNGVWRNARRTVERRGMLQKSPSALTNQDTLPAPLRDFEMSFLFIKKNIRAFSIINVFLISCFGGNMCLDNKSLALFVNVLIVVWVLIGAFDGFDHVPFE